MRFASSNPTPPAVRRRERAFTLIELLVVIAIIGMLAAVGLPALKGFGQSNTITAAQRQLLDDFSAARQRAIAEHTDVYVVFMPRTNDMLAAFVKNKNNLADGSAVLQQVTNLLSEQYTGYALYAPRTVGDQPGRPSGRYLQMNGRTWQSLPDGMFIKADKFIARYKSPEGFTAFTNGQVSFPFPQTTNVQSKVFLPYLHFNSLGQLVDAQDDGSEIVPLARGSIFYDANFNADVLENPQGNSSRTNTSFIWVRIDELTGRSRIERFEMQ